MMFEPSSLPTYDDSLSTFLGQLRDYLLLSQAQLAAHFDLDRSRISRYESGESKPKLGYVAGLAQLVATRMDDEPEVRQKLLQEVNEAARHHYRQGRFRDWAALGRAAEVYRAERRAQRAAKSKPNLAAPREPLVDGWQATLDKRPELPPHVPLIGVEHDLQRLLAKLTSPETPWLLAIDGLGGIGKTALANALLRQPGLAGRFHNLAWVSAKQQNFWPSLGLEPASRPALQAEALIDTLLGQLAGEALRSQPPAQKKGALTDLLKKRPYLIVVDNLETVTDYAALLPLLLKLANPSKFLLTSRHSLRVHSNVFCLTVTELDQANASRFIRSEADVRGISIILNAMESQLKAIYDVVGGNPLALKLVIGQLSILPLAQVLDNLKRAPGKTIDELYAYIYWQAWHMLDSAGQRVFLMMPLAQGGTAQQLAIVSQLELAELHQALQQLVKLSLVQVGGDLEERRYTIHRLTETFLLNEALAWKRSG